MYTDLELAGHVDGTTITDKHIELLRGEMGALSDYPNVERQDIISRALVVPPENSLSGAQGRVDARRDCADMWNSAIDALIRERGPAIGMPCTVRIGSDRYAGRVTWVDAAGARINVTLDDGESLRFVKRAGGWEDGASRPFRKLTLGVARTQMCREF